MTNTDLAPGPDLLTRQLPVEDAPGPIAVIAAWVEALVQLVAGTYVALGVLLCSVPTRIHYFLTRRRVESLEQQLFDAQGSATSFDTEAMLQRARLEPLEELIERARAVVDAWLAIDPVPRARRFESWQEHAFTMRETLGLANARHQLDFAAAEVARAAQDAGIDDVNAVQPDEEDEGWEDRPLEVARAHEAETAIRVLVSCERDHVAIVDQHDSLKRPFVDASGQVVRLRVDRDRARALALKLDASLPTGVGERWRALLRTEVAYGALLVGGLAVLGASLPSPWRALVWIALVGALVAGGVRGAMTARDEPRGAPSWVTTLGGEALIIAGLAVLLHDALTPRGEIGPTDLIEKACLVAALFGFVVVGMLGARTVLDALVPGRAGAILGIVGGVAVVALGVQLGIASADYVGSKVLCTGATPKVQPRTTFPLTLPAPGTDPLPSHAVIDTSCGEITLRLATDTSPTVVGAFGYLADHGLYDGMTWDYAQPDAAVATGDPAGAHGSLPGFSYPVPEARTATFQAGGAGAQIDAQGRASSRFFISGSGGYTVPGGGAHPVLGTVEQGTDVVDALASFGDPADATPDRPLYIFSIRVS